MDEAPESVEWTTNLSNILDRLISFQQIDKYNNQLVHTETGAWGKMLRVVVKPSLKDFTAQAKT